MLLACGRPRSAVWALNPEVTAVFGCLRHGAGTTRCRLPRVYVALGVPNLQGGRGGKDKDILIGSLGRLAHSGSALFQVQLLAFE